MLVTRYMRGGFKENIDKTDLLLAKTSMFDISKTIAQVIEDKIKRLKSWSSFLPCDVITLIGLLIGNTFLL